MRITKISREVAKLLRENEVAQAAVRRKIEAVDRIIVESVRRLPPSPCLRKSCAAARLTFPPIEIKAAKSPTSVRAAKGIARACCNSGFHALIVEEKALAPAPGIHVESHLESASLALLVQDAFQIAGIDATLLLHFGERHPLRVHVGETGLA